MDASQAAGFKSTLLHLVPDLIDATESGLWLPSDSVMVRRLSAACSMERRGCGVVNKCWTA